MEQEKESKAEPVKFPGTVRRILPLFPSAWLIPIAILAMLIVLILPALQKPKITPYYIVCMSNLKGIAISVKLYQSDNAKVNMPAALSLPTADKWNDLTVDYIGREKTNMCPLVKKQDGKTCTYVLNENLYDLKSPIPVPSEIILAFEGAVGWNQTGGAEDMVFRHGTEKEPSCNVAFADGHVERVKESEAANLRWKP